MKSNNDKCHLLISSPNEVSIKIGCDEVFNEKSVKLLGVTIDQNLNFTEHVTKLCKKANMKLHALARVSKYMSMRKLRIIMNQSKSNQNHFIHDNKIKLLQDNYSYSKK